MRADRERTKERRGRQGIVSRAYSTIDSTMHMDARLPEAAHTFRLVSARSASQCEMLDPTGSHNDMRCKQNARRGRLQELKSARWM